MESAINAILNTLNDEVIFINFTTKQDDELVLFAEYFSYTLTCKICSLAPGNLDDLLASVICTVSIQKSCFTDMMQIQDVLVLPPMAFRGLKATTKYINSFIKLLPFKIVKYKRGSYQLLDPDEMDYIGQFVSLTDAKKTCCGNFILNEIPFNY